MSTKIISAIAFALPFLCAGFSAPAALAESTPKAVRADPRIRVVTFQPDQVVAVYGMMGVSTMIEFNSDEHVLTIAMGDTVGWQAVPDSSSQFIYVKPLRVNAVTNLNVVTDKRIYNFILHGDPPGDTRRAVIKLRFSYPDDARDAKQLAALKNSTMNPNLQQAMLHPDQLNYAYGYKGNPENKPVSIFDDGTHTYFQFSNVNDSPAIFAVKSDSSETLVNYRREAQYVVVDKVAKQWTLRNGDVTTCIFNQKALVNGF